MTCKSPNILLILTDQHHARAMGCAGTPGLKTPHLDRIADEGVRFTNAFAASAHCGPSRLSILTGMYEHTHRRHRNTDEPPAWLDALTLPALLDNIGYRTAIIGKGHLGVKWPRRQFDYGRFSMLDDALPGDRRSCDYYRYLVEQGWADKLDDIDPYLHQMAVGKLRKPPCHTAEIPLEHSVETWCGNETVEFLRQRDRERPFMVLMSFDRPHNPLSVPPPYDTLYDPESIKLPANVSDDFETKDAWQRKAARGESLYPHRPRSRAELRKCVSHYYGLISLIDYQIGRVLDELTAQEILDDTIVVFTADHGDFAGEHGFVFKNLGLYDAIHRIPMLMRYPATLPRGFVFDGFVEQVDLFPTLAELTGGDPPLTVEGRSFLAPVRRGERDWTKQAALCEHVTGGYHHVSLRTQRYRLNYDLTGNAGSALCELYDYALDPGELINHWQDPAYREIRTALLCDLLCYRSSPPMMYGASPPGWNTCNCFFNNRGLERLADTSYREEWEASLLEDRP